MRKKFTRARRGTLAVLAFALTFLAGAVVAKPSASLLADPELNRLIDANYALVQRDGWAELRIPKKLHHIDSSDFGSNAVDVAQKLIAAGHEAYVVGGALRDLVMGETANDVDIATNASNEEIKAIMGSVKFHEVAGKVFGIANYPDEALDVATRESQ